MLLGLLDGRLETGLADPSSRSAALAGNSPSARARRLSRRPRSRRSCPRSPSGGPRRPPPCSGIREPSSVSSSSARYVVHHRRRPRLLWSRGPSRGSRSSCLRACPRARPCDARSRPPARACARVRPRSRRRLPSSPRGRSRPARPARGRRCLAVLLVEWIQFCQCRGRLPDQLRCKPLRRDLDVVSRSRSGASGADPQSSFSSSCATRSRASASAVRVSVEHALRRLGLGAGVLERPLGFLERLLRVGDPRGRVVRVLLGAGEHALADPQRAAGVPELLLERLARLALGAFARGLLGGLARLGLTLGRLLVLGLGLLLRGRLLLLLRWRVGRLGLRPARARARTAMRRRPAPR